MIFEFLAVIVVGFVAGGILFGLRRRLFANLASWVIPAGVGFSMIATTVYNEYNWFPYVSGQLPEGTEVVETLEETAFYRPWTYVWPLTVRFTAVRGGPVREDGLQEATLLRLERWAAPTELPVLLDCTQANMAVDLSRIPDAGQGLTGQGAISQDDPVFQAICG